MKAEDEKIEKNDNILSQDDPWMDKFIIIFLVLMILAVLFVPNEWFMKWSMWWNNITP